MELDEQLTDGRFEFGRNWARFLSVVTEQHISAAEGSLRAMLQVPDLAAITGPDPLPRSQVVSKMWDYIRRNNLQNPNNKREIIADDKLRKIFGADRCSMFEMNKHLSRHLS